MSRHYVFLLAVMGLSGCMGDAAPGLLGATFALGPLAPAASAGSPAAILPDARPPKAPGGASSAPGGGGPAGEAAARGQVLVLAPDGERAVEGATVRTGDGRTATTNAAGRFVLPGGFPADGMLVASHPLYVASAVAGLAPGEELTLHLRPRTSSPSAEDIVRLSARGRVVDPGGEPVSGVAVSLEDARGSYSVPAVSGADGVYELTVFAVDGRVENGILLAASVDADPAWLGVADGVGLRATGEIDPVPAQPGNEALVLARAEHRVRITLEGADNAIATLVLEGPQGTRLSLPVRGGEGRVADLPGARYSLKAQALDAAAKTESRLYLEDMAIDFDKPLTSVAATLLAPPDFAATPSLVPGEPISWTPAPGASGYRLTLAGVEGQGFVWEGFTPYDSIRYGYDGPALSGRYSLTLSVWDEAGLAPRTVAAAGLRALRELPLGRSFRTAERRLPLTF